MQGEYDIEPTTNRFEIATWYATAAIVLVASIGLVTVMVAEILLA